MEVDHPTSSAGHNPELFNDQQAIKKYICPICNNVLRDAVQIPQSADPRRACHDCYNRNVRYVRVHFVFENVGIQKFVDIIEIKISKNPAVVSVMRSGSLDVSGLPLLLKNLLRKHFLYIQDLI